VNCVNIKLSTLLMLKNSINREIRKHDSKLNLHHASKKITSRCSRKRLEFLIMSKEQASDELQDIIDLTNGNELLNIIVIPNMMLDEYKKPILILTEQKNQANKNMIKILGELKNE